MATDRTRDAVAWFAAVAAHNRRLGAVYSMHFDRLPHKPKPSTPKPLDKRAKVKAARKQRRMTRG